ncbi:MAG: left-handed beta-roll domain-containing protein [Veillonella sp.]
MLVAIGTGAKANRDNSVAIRWWFYY